MKEDNKLARYKQGYKPIIQKEPKKHVYPDWAFDPDVMECWLDCLNVEKKRKYKKKT